MQHISKPLSDYWRAKLEKLRQNPPAMRQCPVCQGQALVDEVKHFHGRCYECDRQLNERREKLDLLYQPARCGLSPEDKKIGFGRIMPDLQNASVISVLKQWSVQEADGLGVFICGNVGTGKTTLAKCMLNRHMHTELTQGLFLSYPGMFADLKESFESKNNARAILRQARSAALLVIDDLATGASPKWAQDELMPILDDRMNNRRPTIFTCNMLLFEFPETGLDVLKPEHLPSRVLDRIKRMMDVPQIIIAGNSVSDRAKRFRRDHA